MKKLIIAIALCFASFSYAKSDPVSATGTGWKTETCLSKYKYYDGSPIMTHCRKPHFHYLGLKLDVGAPDGLGLSLLYLPVKFLQLELGGTTILSGGGIRAGVMLFLPWYISPSITIEGGKQWGNNVNSLSVLVSGYDPKISLLNDVQYEYANFHGGLGFGSPRWFMFRINAGYSYITTTTNGLQVFVREKANDNSIVIKEATIKAWVPTAKLSFDIYF